MDKLTNTVYVHCYYDEAGNLVNQHETTAAEETKKQIISGLDAAIYLLQDIRAAAVGGMFVENCSNIDRECRNIKVFSEVLKENWCKVAFGERDKEGTEE